MGRRTAIAALTLLLAVVVGTARADPPSRVLRLSYATGAVSFAAGGTDEWVYAPLNRPVVYGDQLWADQDGRGELALGGATLWMGAQTSLRVLDLDDRIAQFEVAQGTVALHVRRLVPGESVEIDTPNLAFVVTHPGRYRVSVDEGGDATVVAVRDGTAEVYGGRSSYVVARGQTYRFYGTDLADSEFLPVPAADPFERFTVDRDRRFDRVASARFVSSDVIGYEDLDRYGTWSTAPDYGNVWYPRSVSADWVPYREGHWSWIDPWGWTWVDDAPWGFAPFHYGRWVYATNRWGWVPGPANVRPVYGPAFVAFVDAGNVRVAVGGAGAGAIGWFPLGPHEVYRPSYNASPQYIRQVNVSNTVINNVTVINNPGTQVNSYVNLRAPNAVTAVPPAAMAQSQTVTRIAHVIPGSAVERGHIQPYAAVAPSAQGIAGPGRPVQGRPPAVAERRPVVARTAPPPPPVPVSQKLPVLQQNPGRPLDTRAVAQAPVNAAPPATAREPRGTAPAPAPTRPTPSAPPGQAATPTGAPPANVRVVEAIRAPTAAPPAKAPDANRATARHPPETPGTTNAVPPAAASTAPATPPPAAQPQPQRGDAAPGRGNPQGNPAPRGPDGVGSAGAPQRPPGVPRPTERAVGAPVSPPEARGAEAPPPAPVAQPPRQPEARPAPPPPPAPVVQPPHQPEARSPAPPPPVPAAQAPRQPDARPAAPPPPAPAPVAQPPHQPEARPPPPPAPAAQTPRPPEARPAAPPPPPPPHGNAQGDKEKDKGKEKDKKDNKDNKDNK